MAGYAFRTFDERKRIEDLWEAGTPAKDIATKLNISASALYTELRRGQDGTRLPDQRRRYNADLAQLRVQQSLERRDARQRKERESMSNFEKITATPEALGAFLASLPVATGPWDKSFVTIILGLLCSRCALSSQNSTNFGALGEVVFSPLPVPFANDYFTLTW